MNKFTFILIMFVMLSITFFSGVWTGIELNEWTNNKTKKNKK